MNGDGSYTYVVDNADPAVDALRLSTDTLTDTFSYQVQDAAGATSSASLTITIHGSNDAPVANADVGSADEAGVAAGSNATGNVLTNDTDVDVGNVAGIHVGVVGKHVAGGIAARRNPTSSALPTSAFAAAACRTVMVRLAPLVAPAPSCTW